MKTEKFRSYELVDSNKLGTTLMISIQPQEENFPDRIAGSLWKNPDKDQTKFTLDHNRQFVRGSACPSSPFIKLS